MIIDIKNAYIGDSSISRIYQGGDLVYDNSHPDVLLEWIANGPDNGTDNPDVYFDTGFTPQLSTKAELKIEAGNIGMSRTFGCGNSSTANSMFNFNLSATGNLAGGGTKNSLKFFYRGADVAAPFTPQSNTQYTVTLWGTYSGNSASEIHMMVNGTTYTRSMTASTNITSAQSAYIFRWHGNEPETKTGVKYYYIKMWEDNNLVRFYIPVLHWTNNQYTPCFYDKVNDTYIYNLGTDTPTYKISGDYLLDYIQNGPDSNSEVNCKYGTGLDTSINLLWDAIVRAPADWSTDNAIFGCGSITEKVPPETGKTYSHQSMYKSVNNGPRSMQGVYYDTSSSSYKDIILSAYDSTGGGYQAYNTGNKILESIFIDATGKMGISALGATSNYDQQISPNFGLAEYVPIGQITLFGLFQQGNPYPQYSRNTKGGARIYALNFRYANNTPAKTFIPVLHNNQAAFLDLNSGTYIYNLGTAAPYYEFKR